MTLLTFVATSKAEQRDGADDAEYVVRQNGQDLAELGIRLEEGETRARRRDDLLFPRARELPEEGLRDGRWRLDCQRVEEHVGGCRHDCSGAQKACAASMGESVLFSRVLFGGAYCTWGVGSCCIFG